MKKATLKIFSIVFSLVIVFCAIVFARTELHGAFSATLYYNDRPWYLSNRFPVENIYGTNYLPITLFVQLPDVNVRVNETLNTFIITHGEYYLSFDVSSNFAANQDKLRMYITTAEYHGERYVPAKIVCMYLNLTYEELTSEATGETAVRIADKNHNKTFNELLNRYYPGFLIEESNTTPPPPPTITDDTSPPHPVLSERTIYIAVDMSSGEYADEILTLLDKYNCTATFFLRGTSLEQKPRLISKIAAKGHAIAIGGDGKTWSEFNTAEEIIEYIETGNEALSASIRLKSSVMGLPHGGGIMMTEAANEIIRQAGYMIWDGNITVPTNATAYRGANIAIDGIWENEIAGIRFAEGKYIIDTLERVLKFIEENSSVCKIRKVSPLFAGYGGK